MRKTIARPPVVSRQTSGGLSWLISHIAPLPACSYFEALETAERRALHSFFDQHVIEDDELGYFALDEGDYNALPAHLAARVVHTVHGGMLDEY